MKKLSNKPNLETLLFKITSLLFFLGQVLFTPHTIGSNRITPKRIQSVLFDKGEPHRVFLNPGLAAVVNFPCYVADSFLGSESDVLVKFSPTTKKSLYLSLKTTVSRPTNLLVRCEDQTTYFVLDLIPSQAVHQDVLEIRASYGRPHHAETELKEIREQKVAESSKKSKKERSPKVIVVKKPILVNSSKGASR